MAKILGVKPKTISAYETGSSFPSLNVVAKAADHFDVSVDYILGRNDNPESHKMRLPQNAIFLKANAPKQMRSEVENYIELLEIKYKIH